MDEETPKRKRAKKKFAKLQRKKRVGVLCHDGKVCGTSFRGGKNSRKARQVVFIIGVAAGKDMLDSGELGPLDDGGPLQVFDDSDSD